MKKDSHLVEMFNFFQDKELTVILNNGDELKVWNSAAGYDELDDFAHISSNVSPSMEGRTIDYFYTNEIKRILFNRNQIYSSDEKLRQINLIYPRKGKMILTTKTYYHWRQLQSEFDDYMASLTFETMDELIEFLKDEYKLTREEITAELAKHQLQNPVTVELNL
ncbi:MAG: hypothetical protein IPH88_10375 [Bacteroidales bacterium]|nr:hypothetical protein [Bacteroidales bacterium]